MTRQRYDEIMSFRWSFGNLRVPVLRYAFPKKRSQYDKVGEPITPGGITEAEEAAIMAKWDTMSGDSCYMNALQALVEGD